MTPPDLSRRRVLFAAGAAGTGAVLTSSTGTASSLRGRGSAALVVHNARVLTGERHARPQEAIAVSRNGTVLAAGPSAVIRRLSGPGTDVVDASGATVMSGIVDAHAHPIGAGTRSLKPSLDHEQFTVEQLLETLRGFLAESAGGEPGGEPDGWLSAVDWNPVGLLPAGTVPHHRILDELPTRRPVALLGGDGHTAWVNRRGLELAGITAETPDPPGGEIVRGPDGSPTGLLKDDAIHPVTRLIPEAEGEELHAAVAKALSHAAAQGVTAFLDAGVTEFELDVYAALAGSDRMIQRVATALRLSPEEVSDPKEALRWVREMRGTHGGTPKLHFGTAKVFLDGVIEHPTRTAALLDPYLDRDGRPTRDRGDLYATAAEFAALARLFDRHGWQLHTHAIGDRAVRVALDGYESARRAGGSRGNRHTIAHLQLVHPDDYPRFARLGVVACMQLQWAMRDVWTMEALLPYIGDERHRRLYPARGLARNGAVLAGGSDWPVDPLGVWNQIRTAVDREGESARQGALHPELQGLGRAAALRMHTAGSAYQLGMERRIGKLTPGAAADLIVLDRDVTRVPVREISDTRVRLTLVGGEAVYDEESTAGKAVRAELDAAAVSLAASARPSSLERTHGGGGGAGQGVGGGRHSACGGGCAPGGGRGVVSG
ncbi:amidohydrolase [Streptomyces jumonjinensis]|uniref:amidohydrolase n=1 Tax=Streptomyces jumonjinensis TaxID=1945 RepID=UPI00378B1890